MMTEMDHKSSSEDVNALRKALLEKYEAEDAKGITNFISAAIQQVMIDNDLEAKRYNVDEL